MYVCTKMIFFLVVVSCNQPSNSPSEFIPAKSISPQNCNKMSSRAMKWFKHILKFVLRKKNNHNQHSLALNLKIIRVQLSL